MLEALRSLRREIDSLLEALRELPGVLVTSKGFRERVEQLYLSWSTLRPQLQAARVPSAAIKRAQDIGEDTVRLTSSRVRKTEYRRQLAKFRQILSRDLLLELARLERAPVEKISSRFIDQNFLPEIPGLTNDLIPNSLYGWTTEMRNFLRGNSFDNNVFIMVAYRAPLQSLITDLKKALTELGLNPVVAREHNLTDDLYNPLACLLCCRYGVAVFDKGDKKQLHNANIVYELAMMQTLKRPCMILKHESVETMPSDFLHKLYEPYSTPKEAVAAVKEWWRRQERVQ